MPPPPPADTTSTHPVNNNTAAAAAVRYAADQLTWLVTFSLGSAPVAVMARLQEDIDECDRKGGRNASIESDENVADWVSLVAAGASKQDVDEVVLPLLAQA
jgi:hypothetical protein